MTKHTLYDQNIAAGIYQPAAARVRWWLPLLFLIGLIIALLSACWLLTALGGLPAGDVMRLG